MFFTMLFICIIQWPSPVTVLRGLHKMPQQGILAGWGRRMGRKQQNRAPWFGHTVRGAHETALSCGAHNRSGAGFGAVVMLQHPQI